MSLHDEIVAKCSPELIASRDCDAIAAMVSDGRVRSNQREIGNGTILETIGLDAGNALLDVINTAPDFRHVKPLVEQGRLIVSSPLVQATIKSLVPTVLTQPQADTICALGFEADPVTEFDVRCALWAANGTWLGA